VDRGSSLGNGLPGSISTNTSNHWSNTGGCQHVATISGDTLAQNSRPLADPIMLSGSPGVGVRESTQSASLLQTVSDVEPSAPTLHISSCTSKHLYRHPHILSIHCS
jgi:hypothetical protein